MLFLSMVPVSILWYQEKLASRLVPIIIAAAIVLTTFLEVVAYINGLWYELSPFSLRVFGLFPLESFVAAFVHILFFIVVYEYFFDDRKTTGRVHPDHAPFLLAGAGGLLSVALAYVYVFSGVFFSYPFALLILLLFVLFVVAIAMTRTDWRQLCLKTLMFAVSILPFSLVYEYIALANDLRFFANTQEYLYTLNFFGQMVPLEEIVFILIVPFWLATTYELYLDDGK